ncbi:MAG: hypothetical protein FWD53_02650 [Phycisphaerales bacterium]|nr:hypothetical protein [Phycisphaerales bacterium]
MAIKAHVSFSVPDTGKLSTLLVNHFGRLGYQMVSENIAGGEWIFRRGSKWATLWRFDIRALDTTLRVWATTETGGARRVSCDWEVYTFLWIARAADTLTLEAEGRELESVLRRQ